MNLQEGMAKIKTYEDFKDGWHFGEYKKPSIFARYGAAALIQHLDYSILHGNHVFVCPTDGGVGVSFGHKGIEYGLECTSSGRWEIWLSDYEFEDMLEIINSKLDKM